MFDHNKKNNKENLLSFPESKSYARKAYQYNDKFNFSYMSFAEDSEILKSAKRFLFLKELCFGLNIQDRSHLPTYILLESFSFEN